MQNVGTLEIGKGMTTIKGNYYVKILFSNGDNKNKLTHKFMTTEVSEIIWKISEN